MSTRGSFMKTPEGDPFYQSGKEQWDYIFRIFPLIDLPFLAFAVYYSRNPLFTLILGIVFPIIASIILYFSAKKKFQPGPWILSINGALCLLYFYVSGPDSPTWLAVINVTVGASFMFNNPKIGQVSMMFFAIAAGLFFYGMGATLQYSLIISSTLLAFVIIFSRAFWYMQMQRRKIEERNVQIEEQKKEMISSINYARRIQYAVLPAEETIARSLPLSFIVYLPKDIVSGDFYWFHQIDRDRCMIACADCTGHGVPGALMTVIGSNLLNQTVIDNQILEPGNVLLELDRLIAITLRQHKDHSNYVADGMDMSLLLIDQSKHEIIISSARRPVLHIRNNQLTEYKGSRNSLGGLVDGQKEFPEIKIPYLEDDIIYLFTDGCTDQFGGDKGKKFSIRNLRQLVLSIHKEMHGQQKSTVEKAFRDWKSDHEQVDDMLLIGIRF